MASTPEQIVADITDAIRSLLTHPHTKFKSQSAADELSANAQQFKKRPSLEISQSIYRQLEELRHNQSSLAAVANVDVALEQLTAFGQKIRASRAANAGFAQVTTSVPIGKREPKALKSSIVEKHQVTKDMAARLSARIEAFEEWFATLPGKIESVCWGPHPRGNMWELGIRFERQGKNWVLEFSEFHPDMDHLDQPLSLDWSKLSDASIAIKLVAVRMFPDLLEAAEKKQSELQSEINTVCDDFDTFAKQIGLKVKEVK